MRIVSRIWQVDDFWVTKPPTELFPNRCNRILCHGFVIWRGGSIQKFGSTVVSPSMLHTCLRELRERVTTNIRPESEWRYRVCAMQISMRVPQERVQNIISDLRDKHESHVYYKPKTGLHAYRLILPNDLGTMLIYDSGAITLFTKDYNRAQYISSIIL